MGDSTAAFRRINSDIPSYESLHLPKIYNNLIEKTFDGLVLVGGVTGCGKSTTLAAMLEHVNSTRGVHIITLEDPVEYTFKNEKAIVSQREIGLDVPSFHDALKYLMREDPDVVFIGEMRDRDTMMAAIQAAETGHLVFGSIHTQDCMQSLARILEFFPRQEHDFIRSSLANSLSGVLCQRLIPAVDPEIGRVPATEVLLGNATVREKIRRTEDEDIPAIISGSADDGMRNFTTSLAELIAKDMIAAKVAYEYAPSPEALKSKVKGIEVSAATMVGRMKG
jgi:twitching motility protein PilT